MPRDGKQFLHSSGVSPVPETLTSNGPTDTPVAGRRFSAPSAGVVDAYCKAACKPDVAAALAEIEAKLDGLRPNEDQDAAFSEVCEIAVLAFRAAYADAVLPLPLGAMIAIETAAQLGKQLEQALRARLPAAHFPEPGADAAVDRIKAKVYHLASPRKRGRPRDAYADAFSQVLRIIPALKFEEAIAEVITTLPLGVVTASEAVRLGDRLRQKFAKFLRETMRAAGLWHYAHRRKVLGDPARAMREAERHRRKDHGGS